MGLALLNADVDITRAQTFQRIAVHLCAVVNCMMLARDGMIYPNRADIDWPFRIQLAVDSHVPFRCSASGNT